MRDKEVLQLGVPRRLLPEVRTALQAATQAGISRKETRRFLRVLVRNPAGHTAHPHFGELARRLNETLETPTVSATGKSAAFKQWGKDLDPESVKQMRAACALPVAVRGALMPDAHVGYGLPIGGVLATDNAVIPYAVGVDIACRMKLSVLDLPPEAVREQSDRLRGAIEKETSFGVGACFKKPREHPVMDRDWRRSPVLASMRDTAWKQLGTSGSGNHFVEFGELELFEPSLGLEPGRYLALLSHSGSRGAGAKVCAHYSRIARALHPDLPPEQQHLAWLDLDSQEGREYWEAMQLMGHYAAANHACIHRHVAQNLGVPVLADLENHHNFAWKEVHDGKEVVVHRKGATPAGEGVFGIIPGTMADPAYIVEGMGNPDSLMSAAHGAGRAMSRTKAKKAFRWRHLQEVLDKAGVTLMSAGLDEAPMAYKNIDTVMSEQQDLVRTVARFQPRLVKMAQAGERPED